MRKRMRKSIVHHVFEEKPWVFNIYMNLLEGQLGKYNTFTVQQSQPFLCYTQSTTSVFWGPSQSSDVSVGFNLWRTWHVPTGFLPLPLLTSKCLLFRPVVLLDPCLDKPQQTYRSLIMSENAMQSVSVSKSQRESWKTIDKSKLKQNGHQCFTFWFLNVMAIIRGHLWLFNWEFMFMAILSHFGGPMVSAGPLPCRYVGACADHRRLPGWRHRREMLGGKTGRWLWWQNFYHSYMCINMGWK